MRPVVQAMLEGIYESAVKKAHKNRQAIHDEQDLNDGCYYVTLDQLEDILKELQD